MTYFWVMPGSAESRLGPARHIGQTFPVDAFIVNVTGSFMTGFFATLTAPDGRLFVCSDARQFVMTGLCGGYTTFLSFTLKTLNLARDGENLLDGANIVLLVVLCLLAVWAGYIAANALNQLKGT
jgi:fluoride exporter